MRYKVLFTSLLFAAMASAKEPKPYQTGQLTQMDSVQCGSEQKGNETLAGEMSGADSSHSKTHDLQCQEYVLQSDNVVYRIRPRDEKHPVLLPVGNRAQFRLEKNKMILRTEDYSGKDRQYVVVSIQPRTENNAADASPIHLNHLQ